MNEELIRSFIAQAIVEGVVDNGVEDFIQATEDSIHRATYFKENGDPIAILDYMLQNSN